jgi:hypothetical protein
MNGDSVPAGAGGAVAPLQDTLSTPQPVGAGDTAGRIGDNAAVVGISAVFAATGCRARVGARVDRRFRGAIETPVDQLRIGSPMAGSMRLITPHRWPSGSVRLNMRTP